MFLHRKLEVVDLHCFILLLLFSLRFLLFVLFVLFIIIRFGFLWSVSFVYVVDNVVCTSHVFSPFLCSCDEDDAVHTCLLFFCRCLFCSCYFFRLFGSNFTTANIKTQKERETHTSIGGTHLMPNTWSDDAPYVLIIGIWKKWNTSIPPYRKPTSHRTSFHDEFFFFLLHIYTNTTQEKNVWILILKWFALSPCNVLERCIHTAERFCGSIASEWTCNKREKSNFISHCLALLWMRNVVVSDWKLIYMATLAAAFWLSLCIGRCCLLCFTPYRFTLKNF